MKILFIGDIVGKSGRDAVSSLLYSLKKENNIDLVIANGENAAHGKGITLKIYKQLLNEGIDYITMGNHTYSKSAINEHMDDMDKLIVPYNHIKRVTDNYYKIVNYKGIKFCIVNILGLALMPESNMSPYDAFSEILLNIKEDNIDFYFVDLHAETTGEKRLFAEYFKDKAKVVIGTHTHVQTADERLIGDVAFISDVGMCGAYESIIGRNIEESINTQINHIKSRFEVAEGDAIFCACIIEIDDKVKRPISIKRIQIRPYWIYSI